MVVIISIEGLRSEAVLQTATPNLDQMVKDGSATWTAYSVTPALPLPTHLSMLRSLPPKTHGTTTNLYTPQNPPQPSLLDAAAQAGKLTGMFYNWPHLRDLALPESLSVNVMHANAGSATGDQIITDHAIDCAKKTDLDCVFLHLGHTQRAGQTFGWMSDDYLSAVTNADECVGRLIDALISIRQPLDVILLSNHGGENTDHVPFVMWGYRCEKAYKIDRQVSILDTAPTAAYLLGIPSPKSWIGLPVLEAIRDTEQAEAHHHHRVWEVEVNED